MNSEKVLKKKYQKPFIIIVSLITSIILCSLIYIFKFKGVFEAIFIILIVVSIVMIIRLISILLSNNRLKKAIKNYSDIEKELDNDNTICIDKYGFYFTNKYFITSKNFNIFRYNDIIWLYFINRKDKKRIIGKDLVIGLTNGNTYNLWTINNKDKDVIKIIEDELNNRVKSLMIGYNEKNKKKFMELKK